MDSGRKELSYLCDIWDRIFIFAFLMGVPIIFLLFSAILNYYTDEDYFSIKFFNPFTTFLVIMLFIIASILIFLPSKQFVCGA